MHLSHLNGIFSTWYSIILFLCCCTIKSSLAIPTDASSSSSSSDGLGTRPKTYGAAISSSHTRAYVRPGGMIDLNVVPDLDHEEQAGPVYLDQYGLLHRWQSIDARDAVNRRLQRSLRQAEKKRRKVVPKVKVGLFDPETLEVPKTVKHAKKWIDAERDSGPEVRRRRHERRFLVENGLLEKEEYKRKNEKDLIRHELLKRVQKGHDAIALPNGQILHDPIYSNDVEELKRLALNGWIDKLHSRFDNKELKISEGPLKKHRQAFIENLQREDIDFHRQARVRRQEALGWHSTFRKWRPFEEQTYHANLDEEAVTTPPPSPSSSPPSKVFEDPFDPSTHYFGSRASLPTVHGDNEPEQSLQVNHNSRFRAAGEHLRSSLIERKKIARSDTRQFNYQKGIEIREHQNLRQVRRDHSQDLHGNSKGKNIRMPDSSSSSSE